MIHYHVCPRKCHKIYINGFFPTNSNHGFSSYIVLQPAIKMDHSHCPDESQSFCCPSKVVSRYCSIWRHQTWHSAWAQRNSETMWQRQWRQDHQNRIQISIDLKNTHMYNVNYIYIHIQYDIDMYIYICVYIYIYVSVHPIPNLMQKHCIIGLQELFVLRHQLRVVLGSTSSGYSVCI